MLEPIGNHQLTYFIYQVDHWKRRKAIKNLVIDEAGIN